MDLKDQGTCGQEYDEECDDNSINRQKKKDKQNYDEVMDCLNDMSSLQFKLQEKMNEVISYINKLFPDSTIKTLDCDVSVLDQCNGIPDRPQLRNIVFSELRSGKPLKASDLYKISESIANKNKFKPWTRQSLYNLLEKSVLHGDIIKTGVGPNTMYSILPSLRVPEPITHDEDLIKKVIEDKVTCNVL